MDVKSIVELFFFYKSNDTMQSIFKDMVSISPFNGNNQARYYWIRQLALQEIESTHAILLNNTQDPNYSRSLEHLASRLTNKHYFQTFQNKESIKEYYNYLNAFVKPSAEEIVERGLKNSFYHFPFRKNDSNPVLNSFETYNNSAEEKKIQRKLKSSIKKEAKLVLSNIVNPISPHQDLKIWAERKNLSPHGEIFQKDSDVVDYYNYLSPMAEVPLINKTTMKLESPEDNEVPF